MQAEIQSMLDKQAISVAGDSSKSFFSQTFLVPKKYGRQRPVTSLKTQPVSEDQALQNGRLSYAERPAKSRRLDGQDRPERCIFHDSHCSGGQRYPQIAMEGPDIPVQLSPVWVVLSSVGLYPDHMTSCIYLAGDRSTSHHLHRRYPRHGEDRVMSQQ